jgi:hypothetical protein
MGVALGLLAPTVVVLVVALIVRRLLIRWAPPSPLRIGLLAVGGAAVLATLVAVAALAQIEDGYLECPGGANRGTLAVAYWLACALGGIALGAVAADRARGGGTLAHHVSLSIGAIALTLVLLTELLFVGLSCYGR